MSRHDLIGDLFSTGTASFHATYSTTRRLDLILVSPLFFSEASHLNDTLSHF
jgi:hypothetical protein